MKKINTTNGVYEYKEKHFENGIKKIDRDVARDNLLSLKSLLDSNNVLFGLIYGTLLGAIRENNFIAHDEDTDLFMLDENKADFLDALLELREIGFEVGRYSGSLISIIRNDEYIDIYFFKKTKTNIRECEGYIIKTTFLENLQKYTFLGKDFNIPQNPEELLVCLYGKDWKTPMEGRPATNFSLYLRFVILFEKNLPTVYGLLKLLRRKLKSNFNR